MGGDNVGGVGVVVNGCVHSAVAAVGGAVCRSSAAASYYSGAAAAGKVARWGHFYSGH